MAKRAEYIHRVYIQDTGIGIDREDQHRVFQKFTQAHNDIAGKYGGAGLGLAISSKLVKLLGGYITLHSEPGRGSTFSRFIPLLLPETSEEKI